MIPHTNRGGLNRLGWNSDLDGVLYELYVGCNWRTIGSFKSIVEGLANPWTVEQTEKGEQLLHALFSSSLDVCSAECSSSQLSITVQGTTELIARTRLSM